MTLRLRVTWSGIGGTPFLSTFVTAGVNQADATAAATAVGTLMGAIDNQVDSGLSWSLVREVVSFSPTTGKPDGMFPVAAATGTGSIAGNQVPFVSQAVIRWRTGIFINGREVRGRTFIPGLQGGNADGVVAAAQMTALDAAASTYIASTPQPMIWSKAHATTHAIISGTTWNQFAVLRSRRPSFA